MINKSWSATVGNLQKAVRASGVESGNHCLKRLPRVYYCSIITTVPGFPKNVHSIDVGDTYATLQWDIPWIFNGILKAFAMSGNEILPEDMDTRSPEIIELRTVPFKNEVPSYNYNVSIIFRNNTILCCRLTVKRFFFFRAQLTGLKPGRTYSIEVFSVISTDFIRLSPPARITITTDNITP